jgi:hypothetical protein
MASNDADNGDAARRRKDGTPKGVRGPGGPPPAPGNPASARSAGKSPRRIAFEEASYPYIRRLHAVPRWIVVVLPAVLLFVGLILTGPLAWLGGILLLIVCLLLAWLTALSWPAITPGSRLLRVVVVVALGAVAVLKFMGRF